MPMGIARGKVIEIFVISNCFKIGMITDTNLVLLLKRSKSLSEAPFGRPTINHEAYPPIIVSPALDWSNKPCSIAFKGNTALCSSIWLNFVWQINLIAWMAWFQAVQIIAERSLTGRLWFSQLSLTFKHGLWFKSGFNYLLHIWGVCKSLWSDHILTCSILKHSILKHWMTLHLYCISIGRKPLHHCVLKCSHVHSKEINICTHTN